MTTSVYPIPSKLFTWNGNVGVTEASDLKVHHLVALPNALQVRSDRTNRVKTFFATENLVDGEGENQATVYKTLDGKLEVHILND